MLLVRSTRNLEILRKRYGVEAQYLPDAVPEYCLLLKRQIRTSSGRDLG
jgi:hypothetical protein